MKLNFLLFAAVMLMSVGHLSAQTTVGGNITSNTTWSISGSPYIVTQDLFIDTGITLTIKAGVVVKFDHNRSLQVDGTIKAMGKSDSLIHFTADTTNYTQPFWSGIFIRDQANPFNFNNESGCQFHYCILEYSGTENYYQSLDGGLFSIYAKVSVGLEHCTIQKSYCGFNAGGSSLVTYCIFSDNTSDAISGPVVKVGGNSQVSKNIFYNNVSAGSSGIVSTNKNIQVSNNLFIENSFILFNSLLIADSCAFYGNMFVDNQEANILLGDGMCFNNTIVRNSVYISTISVSDFAGVFYNNNILMNESDIPGVELEFASISQGSTSQTTFAENNWWGYSDSASIATVVSDHSDNGILGTVDYSPFLDSPDTIAPVTPPVQVFKKTLPGGDVEIYWNPNKEADLKGYKVNYNGFNGYSFLNFQDAQMDTFAVIPGVDINNIFGVTAYDVLANGVDDQLEGHESWFTYALPDSTVGIHEISSADAVSLLQIYPNPCNSFFNIKTSLKNPPFDIWVYDALGRIIKKMEMHDPVELISTNGFNPGIYMVALCSDGVIIDRCKLMIQHRD